jgi:predicted house-cleaning NTP pyrophosphatase (Maf/HAM1 superfamily)
VSPPARSSAGIHLFRRSGRFFTILGLPLVPLLGYLREAGVVVA